MFSQAKGEGYTPKTAAVRRLGHRRPHSPVLPGSPSTLVSPLSSLLYAPRSGQSTKIRQLLDDLRDPRPVRTPLRLLRTQSPWSQVTAQADRRCAMVRPHAECRSHVSRP